VTDDDDKTWLDVLAGRKAADADAPAARDARLLRDAINRQRQPENADVPGRDPQREAALLARAQREGLIDPNAVQQRWVRPGRGSLLALACAAALGCIAIGMAFFLRSGPQPIVRGVHDQIITIEAPDPQRLKDELLQELRTAGVPASGYERLGVQGVDADLPQPTPAAVRAVLDKHNLPLPSDGVLKIEIAPEPGAR
jgi:hypothetical protein